MVDKLNLIDACQCTLPEKQCVPSNYPLLSENENRLLSICVSVSLNAIADINESVTIQNVTSFIIDQEGGLAVTYISPTYKSPLVNLVSEGGSALSISTELISAFFLEPANVNAKGTVLLKIDEVRQLFEMEFTSLTSKRHDRRSMQGETEAMFDVLVPLAAPNTRIPSAQPSQLSISEAPSNLPTSIPSLIPSAVPSISLFPSQSARPSSHPKISSEPTFSTHPSSLPSTLPSHVPSRSSEIPTTLEFHSLIPSKYVFTNRPIASPMSEAKTGSAIGAALLVFLIAFGVIVVFYVAGKYGIKEDDRRLRYVRDAMMA
eukprot:CAMPEP_0196817794 /NCGR_PEP_ID=MMETSP1362-20130617/62588_1 /TAXON_ID=163516 /ORGANISM="Leptocylindrus danicus, Strain CCMP1856" /LENGTH=317 /DNA_ID=CAMNT_0042195633 /DNA_START=20 /DNA_END=969 /DNA_ORIENTATION=+